MQRRVDAGKFRSYLWEPDRTLGDRAPRVPSDIELRSFQERRAMLRESRPLTICFELMPQKGLGGPACGLSLSWAELQARSRLVQNRLEEERRRAERLQRTVCCDELMCIDFPS